MMTAWVELYANNSIDSALFSVYVRNKRSDSNGIRYRHSETKGDTEKEMKLPTVFQWDTADIDIVKN